MKLLLLLSLLSVSPKEELRFQFCHEQGFDSSCGLSVVSTVLDRYWKLPATELQLLELVLDGKRDNDSLTISFADMVRVFESYGLAAKAFRADWSALQAMVAKGFRPLVVHYDRPEKHFALLLGFSGGRAILADPASGLESLSQRQFTSRFSGAVLALASSRHSVDEFALAEALRYANQKQALLEATAGRVGPRW